MMMITKVDVQIAYTYLIYEINKKGIRQPRIKGSKVIKSYGNS